VFTRARHHNLSPVPSCSTLISYSNLHVVYSIQVSLPVFCAFVVSVLSLAPCLNHLILDFYETDTCIKFGVVVLKRLHLQNMHSIRKL